MAIEGSHVRIALAVKDKIGITDVGAYLRGTIYPDSRYVTKLDRILTHPTDYKTDPMFKRDDFYKGWFVHLLCDDIQYKAMQEALPAVCEGVDGQGSDVWIRRTAIKIIQDMFDVKAFDIISTLPHFEKVFAPNGEDMVLLQTYNDLFVQMYKNHEDVSVEKTYSLLWSTFGIDEDTLERLIKQTKAYAADTTIASKAEGLYKTVVNKLTLELVSWNG